MSTALVTWCQIITETMIMNENARSLEEGSWPVLRRYSGVI